MIWRCAFQCQLNTASASGIMRTEAKDWRKANKKRETEDEEKAQSPNTHQQAKWQKYQRGRNKTEEGLQTVTEFLSATILLCIRSSLPAERQQSWSRKIARVGSPKASTHPHEQREEKESRLKNRSQGMQTGLHWSRNCCCWQRDRRHSLSFPFHSPLPLVMLRS